MRDWPVPISNVLPGNPAPSSDDQTLIVVPVRGCVPEEQAAGRDVHDRRERDRFDDVSIEWDLLVAVTARRGARLRHVRAAGAWPQLALNAPPP